MKRLSASLLALALICSFCFAAPNPVGTWKGKFVRAAGKPPEGKSPAEKAAIKLYNEMMTSMRAKFVVKADHTFTMDLRGTVNGKPQGSLTEGTWKLEGMTVVTRSLKRDGTKIPKESQTTNRLVLSKDGKTLTREMNSPLAKGKIVLNKV